MNKTKKSVASNIGRPLKYPFNRLKKGKSLLFPLKIRNNVAAAAYMWMKRNNVKLRVLNLTKKVRILRVA
jgi:hypothetical protein